MKQFPYPTGSTATPRRSQAGRFIIPPLAAVLLAGSVLLPTAVPAARAEASVHAEEVQQETAKLPELKPFIMEINGRQESIPGAVSPYDESAYAAIRAFSEKLGLEVTWDPQNSVSTITGRHATLSTKVGDLQPYTINGQTIYGPEPLLVDGTTYLPVALLMDTFGYTSVTDEASGVTTVTPLPLNPLTITTGVIDETSDKLEFKLQFPQIKGLADTSIQDKINTTIQAEVTRMAEASRQDLENAGDSDSSRGIPNGYTVDYVVTQNSSGKLSLYLQSYLFTGGAHGIPARVPFTFDLSTGDVLTLQQAAGNNPDYAAVINRLVKEEFAKWEMMLEPFQSISENQPYFLRNNEIVVYFAPYQYTPYVAGFPEFTIPQRLFE